MSSALLGSPTSAVTTIHGRRDGTGTGPVSPARTSVSAFLSGSPGAFPDSEEEADHAERHDECPRGDEVHLSLRTPSSS